MNFRILKWQGSIFIVVGIGYNSKYDPPDVYFAVPLSDNLFRSVITHLEWIEIPFYQAIEITDKSIIQSIWILYGK